MYIKYPIALTKELAIKWELDNIQREYTFDLIVMTQQELNISAING